MNALVLDDEKESLLLFSSCLIDVPNISLNCFAMKCDEALSYARSNYVDVAFLDIVMPLINGIDFAKKLIQINPNIKIVFITGYAQNIEEIKKAIGNNFFDFCYKPYDEETIKGIIVRLLSQKKTDVSFITFPRFNMYVNGVLVDFERAKSKELLALLVDHHGEVVTMEEAITKLWIDKKTDLAKRLYRDAVSRLRIKLKQYGVEHIVTFNRARSFLNLEGLTCDYWDYLNNEENNFHGEYMRPYEWAIEKEEMLVCERADNFSFLK